MPAGSRPPNQATQAPVQTPGPTTTGNGQAGATTEVTDAAGTAIVSGTLIGIAVVVSVVGWATNRALDRLFEKKKR